MCIIAIVPSLLKRPKDLTEDEFGFMWDSNSDGAGLSYVKDNRVHIDKGIFKLSEFTEIYYNLRKQVPDSPFVVHFRYSTAGLDTTENCHPFQVHDMAMFHNGTFYTMDKHKQHSDSFLMAEQLNTLPKGFLKNTGYTFLFDQYIKKNRVCFMSPDKKVTVFNKPMWDEVDGITYSNKFYKVKRNAPLPAVNVYNNGKLYDQYDYNPYGYRDLGPKTTKFKDTRCGVCNGFLDDGTSYFIYPDDTKKSLEVCRRCKNAHSMNRMPKKMPQKENCALCRVEIKTLSEIESGICDSCFQNSYA